MQPIVVFVYLNIYIYMCVCVCIYIYIYNVLDYDIMGSEFEFQSLSEL